MSQKSFRFDFDEEAQDEDFILSSSNEYAYKFINNWPDWPSNIALIYGEKSSGKTYLANIWQRISGAKFIDSQDIYLNNKLDINDKCYILEDIENVHDEAAFFHFFNKIKESGCYLLMTSPKHPNKMGIRLADLRSRLSACANLKITNPDNELLKQIFFKKFVDRQLKVEMNVIEYLITRIERSFGAVQDMVDILDKEALKQRKNITIPFAKKILELSG